MSFRKRGDRWVVQVYDPRKGSKVWVGTFETKDEAREAEHKAWREIKSVRGRQRETIDSFAERWMGDYPRARESTTRHYDERIKAFANEFTGRDLRSVDRVEARAWALKNRSRFQTVRAMYSDAVRDGLCDTNPFMDLRLEQSRGRKDLVVPTEGELGQMILEARKLHGKFGERVLGNFIQFGAYSGLRPGELYGLRWEDIDFDGHTVRVERQFNQKTRKFTETKSGKPRTIYLTPQAAEATRLTPKVRDEVFSAPRGGLLSGTVMSTYWQPVARSVGRPEFTPHCLRHFFGTHLAGLGLGPFEIAQAMGHQDGGKLAMERYIHMAERDARERIARAFGGNVRDLRPVVGGETAT